MQLRSVDEPISLAVVFSSARDNLYMLVTAKKAPKGKIEANCSKEICHG